MLDGEDEDGEDDGSRDGTLAVLRLLAAQDRRVSAVSFSRNFGKEIAIAAGLTKDADSDAIVAEG